MRHNGVTLVAVNLVAVLVAAAGCGSGDNGGGPEGPDFSATPAGTLRAWGFNSTDDVGRARLAHAQGLLGGVTIEIDQTGFDAQKFTTRIASGNLPDVVQMDRQYVATYAAQRLILPMDRCYSAKNVDPKARFYPAVIGDVTYENQVWAVPQFFQPPTILINKKLTGAAGVADAEFDTSNPTALLGAIAKLYKESGGVPATLGFHPVATGQTNLWMLGLGGRLIDEKGAPTLDDPANVYPLETLKRILDAQGGFAKVKSFGDSFDVFGQSNQFVTDKVAAEVNFQWYVNVLAPYKDRLELSAVPFKGKDGKPVAIAAGATAFVIPAGAKNPSAACAWALALTSQDNWMAAAEARAATVQQRNSIFTGLFTGSPDADRAIREKYVKPSGNAGFDQVIATYYDVVGAGRSFGASPAGQQIQQELINAITATSLGSKSAQQALADAQAAAKRAYDTVVRG
ncbi:ABC transporter substrate-binding protein [Allorhizocola rhizosphaerae]|uniref:ABC transporter substrate-binding protein n=1 Tax=Allorhizocola rhizosphaerae TaxID=1872709 RepID=UPI000E3CA6B3|nr:extracellular solute-binding protein [Allorhizocola rhizosphaerae]